MQEPKQAPATARQPQRPFIALMSVALFLICTALLAATAWTICSSRETRLREAKVATENMARTLASQADTAIKIADVILYDIVERSERDGSNGEAGKRLDAYLVQLTRKVTEIHGLFIYDETGAWKPPRWACPSRATIPTAITLCFTKPTRKPAPISAPPCAAARPATGSFPCRAG